MVGADLGPRRPLDLVVHDHRLRFTVDHAFDLRPQTGVNAAGTYVVVGVRDLGRWFGLGGQTEAPLLSPFVRQRMRVFVLRHKRADLGVLKEAGC